VDFAPSERVARLTEQVRAFVDDEVIPAEATYRDQVAASGNPHHHPPVMEELKAKARSAGLWNLFLPDEEWGGGLSTLEYAPLCEHMGRSTIGPEVFNCNAPDTGNMEVLALYGSRQQQQDWLAPLADGEIRSCFSMTEPEVASSDATNIAASITPEGDEYVVNGRKWWTSGAARSRCKLSVFMGKTDPEAEPHRQHSMVLVPLDAPGVTVERTLSVFGYDEGEGHAEMSFDNVRVPADNLIKGEGEGFAIAQGRLGPGRVHHCMRLVGMTERALALMCQRAHERAPFGKPLERQGVVRNWIAESRCAVEQARMLVLHAAWKMATYGNQAARPEIAAIKIVAPRMACDVVDRAIQAFGGAGVSQDTPLDHFYASARALRLADGPDEVHLQSLAKQELARQLPDGS
jgi:acyl-CoA dehydrogenase